MQCTLIEHDGQTITRSGGYSAKILGATLRPSKWGPKIVYRGLICVKARSSRYMNHFATQRSPLLIFHGTLLAPVVVGYFTFVELFGIAMVLAYI